MIWVAWKQHRAGVLTALGVVAAFAALMLFMRFSIESTLADMDAPGCLSKKTGCPDEATIMLLNKYGFYLAAIPVVLCALPVVLGIFVGAPLFAKELSQGTHMFSLTQGTSRKRWWAAKLSITLVPIVAAVGLLGLVSRWALGAVLNPFFGPLAMGTFELQGTVMMGYLVLAFALAATFGLLTRNNVVPMVITVGVYIAVVAAILLLARPSYLPPMSNSSSDKAAIENQEIRVPDGAWLVQEVYIAKDGTRYNGFTELCEAVGCEGGDLVSVGAEYHPASRFWIFQGIETGVYLVLGVAVLAVGARRLRALP